MNRYKFQMGAELPPEMIQQMQGMPIEQGIPMEQGMPVEHGNGEASFAQQLMDIEQEIDKIQKEMKKLEKRNDRLAQNEYKRLEQQLMQLEQQKEMLRQQVEATRQQLEAQEQMQGEEYLDPNAQYEMSPEELDVLEGQYQDVPMEEQINPDEMQMMRCGGKMQVGNTKLASDEYLMGYDYNSTAPIPEGRFMKVNGTTYDLNNKEDKRNFWKAVANDKSQNPEQIGTGFQINSITPPRITHSRPGLFDKNGNRLLENIIYPNMNLAKMFIPNLSYAQRTPFVQKEQTIEEPMYDDIIDVEDTSNGYTIPFYEEAIKNINPNDILDGEEQMRLNYPMDDYFNLPKYSYNDEPIVMTPNTRRDLRKTKIQSVKDYFGDRPLSDYANLAIAAAGMLDNMARLNNEIARNMTLTDNPYPRIMNNINEYSEGVKQAINREYTQVSNRLRNDIRRAESSVQPRSVFGRSANLMAMQDTYNENQNKLDADYQTKLAANEADRIKQYNAAFENYADTERANKIYNMNKLTNALEKDDKITANKYNLAQTELNRWGEIEQDRRDRDFLETTYRDNMYNNLYASLLSANVSPATAQNIIDKMKKKDTKKTTKKGK